jgi:hypothetical protein
MSDQHPAATPQESLGVVDPIRIPGAARARHLWASLPQLSRIFVVAAALDVIVRALGLLGTQLNLYLDSPLSWFTAFFPHDALILLPALILARRPDALEATPMVMRGSVLVALVTLLDGPLRGFVSGNPIDPIVAPTVVSILGILLMAGGWWWMAQGVRVLNPVRPAESFAGLANLVGGGIAIAALANLAIALFGQPPDIGNPTWTSLLQLNSAMFAVQSLALASLARAVVVGTGDPTRPREATYLATAALTLLAIGSLLQLVALPGAIFVALYWITGPVAMTAFLAAFPLGLTDPSGTIERAVHTEQPVPA